MLKRRQEEINDGAGPPNILATIMEERGDVKPRSKPPAGSATFTPLAAKAERCLQEIRQMDERSYFLLEAYGMDISYKRMSEIKELSLENKSHAQNDVRDALTAFGTLIWLKTRRKEW